MPKSNKAHGTTIEIFSSHSNYPFFLPLELIVKLYIREKLASNQLGCNSAKMSVMRVGSRTAVTCMMELFGKNVKGLKPSKNITKGSISNDRGVLDPVWVV